MIRRRWRPDPFLVAIAGAVTAAALFPRLGVRGGVLHVDAATAVAVAAIFFLHGALLPLDALRHGVRNLRLHLVAQGSTYLLFPLLGLIILRVGFGLPPAVALGFFFLCTVSSTMSSSVAMTSVAGGDVAGAMFNATLSGVMGIFITPAWVSSVAGTVGVNLPLVAAIEAVALKILLPLSLGQLCRPYLLNGLVRHRQAAETVDRASIVLIVYGAFCESVAAGVWTRATLVPTVVSVAVAAALMAVVSTLVGLLIRFGRLDRSSAIAAYFCGTQKSLANGLTTAQALFGLSPAMGLIAMPLLVYHQVQLGVGSVVARRLGGWNEHD